MAIADLGYFVLDAKVETAAYTIRALRDDEREQLTISLLGEVNSLVAEVGSPFSVAKYRDHRALKRYQAEQELGLLESKQYVHFVGGRFPQYRHDTKKIANAAAAETSLYPPLIAFRLLMEDDKENALLTCVQDKRDHRAFVAQPRRFDDLPNHSFAYWLNKSYRRAFLDLEAFANDDRTVKQGLATAKDPRFVRAWWEVDASETCPPDEHPSVFSGPYCVAGPYRWFPFSKGGKYSPYFGEIPHVINWFRHGEEVRAYSGSVIRNPDYYFRPGLTYLSRNTVRTCAMPLPAGTVFGHTGPGVFADKNDLPNALARFSSYVVDGFLSVSHGQGVERMSHRKQYEVGIMKCVPWSNTKDEEVLKLVNIAHESILAIRANEETSRFFLGSDVDTKRHLEAAVDALWQIDLVVAGEFGVDVHDLLLKGASDDEKKKSANQEIRAALKLAGGFPDKKTVAHNQLSYAVGCVFGRWDIQFVLGTKQGPSPPEIFDPLPISSPGMLTDADGLPADTTPKNYPIDIQWDGILVDDPGIDGNHPKPNDIVKRVRDVLVAIHGTDAESTEQDICTTLKIDDLRDYFKGASQYFERHQKAYRKGGRDAPIYWPLASASGSYTLWIYYPRLNEQTLYTAVNKYVVPKIEEVERRVLKIGEAIGDLSGKEATEMQDERDSLLTFQTELETFRDELLRIADLPYKPDLNDGVMICAAPLWESIAHSTWSQKLKTCWEGLSEGEFDWAHLAFSIWPERVRAAADTDLSIAIAHGLATGDEVFGDDVQDDPDEDDETVGDEDEGDEDE
ncbi:MAG: hypothetical protein AAF483_01865 [Planctomycetota bacterium]